MAESAGGSRFERNRGQVSEKTAEKERTERQQAQRCVSVERCETSCAAGKSLLSMKYIKKEIKCCEVLSKDNAQQEGCVPNGIARTAFCFENGNRLPVKV